MRGEKWVLGIDVGGTKIKSGLINDTGECRDFKSIPTATDKEPLTVLSQLADLIQDYQDNLPGIAGIGLALPGSVNDREGVCLYCPNLRLRDVPLSQKYSQAVDLPVRLLNDANAACLGEYFYGKNRGAETLLCITLGTGVGSGLIFKRRLFVGSGSGAEAGHMIIDPNGPPCACGSKGCWETYVSANAVVRRCQEQMASGPPTILKKWLQDEDSPLTAELIFKAYRLKDPLAQRIVFQTKEYLAIGLANLVNLLNLSVIVLTGGLAEAGPDLLEGLAEKMEPYTYPPLRGSVRLEYSILGPRAGVLGVASLWHKEMEWI